MAESPRPTREQVDALAEAERMLRGIAAAWGGSGRPWDHLVTLLAEYDRRAAELDEIRAGREIEQTMLRSAGDEILRLRAALAARTPQPAEPRPAEWDQLAHAVARRWRELDVAIRGAADHDLGDLLDLLADTCPAAAPQPAVPDGEATAVVRHLGVTPAEPDSTPSLDAALADLVAHREANDGALSSYASGLDDAIGIVRDHLRFGSEPDGPPLSDLDARQVAAVPALLRLCDEAEQHTATRPVLDGEGRVRAPYLTTADVRRAVASAVPGEDVPARLEAAAKALEAADWLGPANSLRQVARVLRRDAAADARAAVAAAWAAGAR